MFEIVSSKTGEILFTTNNEREANEEFAALTNEDGLEVEFL